MYGEYNGRRAGYDTFDCRNREAEYVWIVKQGCNFTLFSFCGIMWAGDNMKMMVFSCDKCQDTFEAFHKLVEKYYPNHPEIIYITETVKNPYYKTICVNCDLSR